MVFKQKFVLFCALAIFCLAFSAGECEGSTSKHFQFVEEGAPRPELLVYFSPYGGATDAIVNAISSADKSILVQAFSFTSRPITQALAAAEKRGVNVQVILDANEAKDRFSKAVFLARAGIQVSLDAMHKAAHNKVMILDEKTVITGSFNFTTSAEIHNAENVLIINDTVLAQSYLENWRRHRDHSQPYQI